MEVSVLYICNLICSAVILGVPLLYGAVGEIITEKSGHLNLGIPGTMYVGAVGGVAGAFVYENACGDIANMNPALAILIPLVCSLIGAALMGLIYSFLTVTLRANQNVTGLALTTFGIGIGNFLTAYITKLTGGELPNIILTKTNSFFEKKIPIPAPEGPNDWKHILRVVFDYDFLTYVAIIIAIIAGIVLAKTRIGLNLRAVGESPATADAAGINVTKYRYLSTIIGSAVAGLGGLQYVMAYADGVWSNNAFGDRGWMAIALVIFVLWKPTMAILGAFLFGALCNANNYVQGLGVATQELFNMLPYIVTIVVLIITSTRKKREHQPPASLGVNYFREDR